MIGSSAVILVMILLVAMIFMQRRQKKWAISTLTLGILPLINIIGPFLSLNIFGVEKMLQASLISMMIGVIIGSGLSGVCSALLIKTRRNKISFFLAAVAFNLTFAIVLVIHYINLYQVYVTNHS